MFGREILVFEVVGADEEDADDLDTPLYELSAETERADLAEWRDDHDEAQIPPTVLVAGHSRRRRPRPEVVRIGTRHHQDRTPRATAARRPASGFGFTHGEPRQ